MDFQPNTSLHLSLPNGNKNNNININLDLFLEHSPSNSSSSNSLSSSEPTKVFACNYCQRKFYSSQALGGHQNAHKLERTLAKKSRELTSRVARTQATDHLVGLGPVRSGSSPVRSHHQVPADHDHHHHHHHHLGWFGGNGSWSTMNGYRADLQNVHQDEIAQIDLSLRL